MSPGAGAASGISWTSPANVLTLLRVALVPVIAVLLFIEGSTARWWAVGLFIIAALSDWGDGWAARRWQDVTRWGKLADPLADKLLIVGTLAVLAWLGELPWWAVTIIVLREGAVTIQRQMLLRHDVVMSASVYGKTKTVAQVVALILYLLPGVPRGLAFAALVVAVTLTVASGIEYAWRGQRLLRAG
ncbi:MAG: CDP-diacylglycerol--glycerol-3-phosphate 3-phosphatidyltransferase [Nitriliruptorales bacterium]|nr:CDP-diacylglycerol--glycerol-3-phosphate 3-phosphatidyltransferase [Nitriliruptorales bacterium]